MTSSDPETTQDHGPIVRAVEPFEAFYRRMYRPLVGLAVVLSGRRDVAEDVVQDSLTAAFRSWSRVGRLEDPAGWVRRVVANRSISLFRRSVSEVKALARMSRSVETQPADAGVAEALELWANVVRLLPRKQAMAVALRYTGDLTLAEISSIMDCSTSTTNTHLRRAHERLSQKLGTEWKEDW